MSVFASRQLVKWEVEVLQYSFDSFSATLASMPVIVVFVCDIFWSLMDNNSNVLKSSP